MTRVSKHRMLNLKRFVLVKIDIILIQVFQWPYLLDLVPKMTITICTRKEHTGETDSQLKHIGGLHQRDEEKAQSHPSADPLSLHFHNHFIFWITS